MKLDFVCIGAQKAGTTTLHDILNTHPDIYLPPNKEAHFFNIDEYYEKGLNFYFETFFHSYEKEKYIGNINPNLHNDITYLRRIKECFGQNIKIIFILRDPVKRAYSHYLMSKRRGYEKLSFLNALEAENDRLKSTKIHHGYKSKKLGHFEKNHFSYIQRGKYFEVIEFLFNEFNSKNIKIILFEEFIENTSSTINDIIQFLDIPFSTLMSFDKKSNEAFETKNEVLRDFIRKPSYTKKILKIILDEKFKNKIKSRLNKINKKTISSEKNRLNKSEYQFVYNKYFDNEILDLEKYLGKSLKKWKY